MRLLNGYRIKLVLCGFMVAVLLGGGSSKADFTFGTPENLGPTINSSYGDYDICFSPDGLMLFFSSNRSGGYGSDDLYLAMRPSIEDSWGEPVNLGPTVNSSYYEIDPDVSTDGLSLFFSSNRPGGYGSFDIWLTKRATTQDDWGEPVNLGPAVNSPQDDEDPSTSTDSVSLLFSSNRSGGHGNYDIWITTQRIAGRQMTERVWGKPINLGPSVNTSYYDLSPSVSPDGRILFFNRGTSYMATDLWMTRRNTEDDDWGETVDIGQAVNSLARDGDPEISADCLWLFFNSDRPGGVGGEDIWQASIKPIVDLNSDGKVDAADMCIIVDHWGTDEPLCDIGPMPWGDGIVDVQDLIVLAEHLFEEVPPAE